MVLAFLFLNETENNYVEGSQVKTSYPFPCLLLSGMPCTGKDTLTHQLIERDPSFAFLRKHRADPSSQPPREDNTYIHVSPETFSSLAQNSGFLQFHGRYGRMYGVSREEYAALIDAARIPIIHVGKYENLHALRENGLHAGLSLLLWADRPIVHSRLLERHKQRTDGVEERLVAYDQEVAQLKSCAALGELDFDLVFVNNGPDPVVAADTLLSLLRSPHIGSKKEAQHELSRFLDL